MEADDQAEAAARARWLGELTVALRDAERLTSALAHWQSGSLEAVLLRTRILAARASVESLQRRQIEPPDRAEIAPLWTPNDRPAP